MSHEHKRKTDVMLKGFMAGEGPVTEAIPVNITIVRKCIYEAFALCENGVAQMVISTLKDNRELVVKGTLTNAVLKIGIQQGEETPLVTTIVDNDFKVFISLKKGDEISFAFEAGDDFEVKFDAVVRTRGCFCN